MGLWDKVIPIKSSKVESSAILSQLEVDSTQDVTELIKKAKKFLTSKKATLSEKIYVINKVVSIVLGKYSDRTQVIYDREDLHNYILSSIHNGVIAIDTETNNSIDPLTCKLMGVCLYTKGQKNVYIPINHIDINTNKRIESQLTEQDIYEELSLLKSNDCKIIMHNAKFDYKVLYCTCNLDLRCYWDTILCVGILNENEKHRGLKYQYIDKCDKTQVYYSIDALFADIPYEIVPIDTFSLYSATDAFETYELFKWQKSELEKEGNEKLKSLFLDIEMPCLQVVADMELTGISLNEEYAHKLSVKYHKKLDEVSKKIYNELEKYQPLINKWKETPDANRRNPKPGNKGYEKSKVEQLGNPINLDSPVQLSILLYDILNVGIIDESMPRGTGESILEQINLPICKYILERRGILKLLDTYIDILPKLINPKTKRIHAEFNQLGAETGRFSSSNPNLQNIPASNKEIRIMFQAKTDYIDVKSNNDVFTISSLQEVETSQGWKLCKDLDVELDELIINNVPTKIKSVLKNNDSYLITI